MAGCATPIGFAGHAPTSATANSELTFYLDHSMGADHCDGKNWVGWPCDEVAEKLRDEFVRERDEAKR